jgi:serine/threonine protein kinase
MLDNFKIIKSLGHGCSSKVFLVEDDCGQKYAAKVIRKDKKYSQAFSAGLLKGEFHKLMKFEHHPNFIRAYQVNLEGTFISGST